MLNKRLKKSNNLKSIKLSHELIKQICQKLVLSNLDDKIRGFVIYWYWAEEIKVNYNIAHSVYLSYNF